MPLVEANWHGCTLTKHPGLYVRGATASVATSALILPPTTILHSEPSALALDLGPHILTALNLQLASVSEWQALEDRRWSVKNGERFGYRAPSRQVSATLTDAGAETKHEWQAWQRRAAEAHDLGHRLAKFGFTTAAEEARNSGKNFALVGSLIENVEAQPLFIHEALPGYGAIVARVFTIADAGYTFLRSYVRVRAGEQARNRRRHAAAMLAQAISRIRENLPSLIARRWATDRTRHDDNLPDSPHRAKPRETRAGPTSKEPTEPGHEADGCQCGEASSNRPAIGAGTICHRPLFDTSFDTPPPGPGTHV